MNRKRKTKYIFVRTTRDKFEYPIAIADSARELAEMLGIKTDTVWSKISRKSRYWYKIPLEDEN